MHEDNEIKKILTDYKNIAVVGASKDPSKASNDVLKYLKEHDYITFPVNPYADHILGEKVYHSLSEIKEPVDIVDIFRPRNEVYPIVEEALDLKPKVIWMQLGIENNKAARLAEKNGIEVIMNKCIMAEHKRLL
jgi:predicted CoA-binding protein